MKKMIVLAIMALLVGAFFVGCVSNPPEKQGDTAKPTLPPPPPPQIIEHKLSDFGGQPPAWVSKTALELEKTKEYENFYVFIVDEPGQNLDGLKTYAKNFVAASEVARMVSTRVEAKFVGAAAGDKDMLETYMENVVKTVSKANFSGMRVNDEFWVKKRYFTQDGSVDKEEYRYLFLITVPRKAIDDAVKNGFDSNKPVTKEETAAVDRVKSAWGEGLD